MKSFLFILFLPHLISSQVVFKGKVIDKTSKAGIPYATVAHYKANVGTNANENGDFILNSPGKNDHDTLLISSVGYQTRFVPSGTELIELERSKKTLAEIVIKSKSIWTYDTLHKFSKTPSLFLSTKGFQIQVAQPFKSPVENAILTEVKIERREKTRSLFRLRIYNRDTITKSPIEELCSDIIEIESASKLIVIDLERYKIQIPGKEFFIAVEWLKIPVNEYQFKGKQGGNFFEETRYRPSIRMTSGEPKNFGAWSLDYNNFWRPMFDHNNPKGVAISVTVKY